MPCPLFKDFTRECIVKFPSLVKFRNYDVCELDDSSKCPIFVVCTSNFNCKYMEKCMESFLNAVPNFLMKIIREDKQYSIIKSVVDNYCLHGSNNINCKRYKIIENGETPSYKLFPDGKSHYLDLVLGKEITIK